MKTLLILLLMTGVVMTEESQAYINSITGTYPMFDIAPISTGTTSSLVIFQDRDKTAKLFWKDGKFSFEGDYDMAAEKFAEYLTKQMIIKCSNLTKQGE